jgi:hypothetical protein
MKDEITPKEIGVRIVVVIVGIIIRWIGIGVIIRRPSVIVIR